MASKITNEMLADKLEKVLVGNSIVIESAARLRQQDITIAAQKAKGAAEGYAHGCEEVADLRRLKVAEDAMPMPYFPNICDKANLVIREFEKVSTRRPDGLTVIDCECSRLECAVEELKEALREASWEEE